MLRSRKQREALAEIRRREGIPEPAQPRELKPVPLQPRVLKLDGRYCVLDATGKVFSRHRALAEAQDVRAALEKASSRAKS